MSQSMVPVLFLMLALVPVVSTLVVAKLAERGVV